MMNRSRNTLWVRIGIIGMALWFGVSGAQAQDPVPPEEPKPEQKDAPQSAQSPATPVPSAAVETAPTETPNPESPTPEVKPAEIKPAEVKSTDVKPAETKSDEPKKEEKKYETVTLQSQPLEMDVNADAILWPTEAAPVKILLKQWMTLKVKTAVEHGQFVKKGDTLVTFDMEDYNASLEEKKIEIALAKLTQEKAKIQLELARKQFEWNAEVTRRSRAETQDSADFTAKYDFDFNKRMYQLSLKSAEFALAAQKSELEQLEKMYKSDDMTDATEEMVLQRQRRAVEDATLMFDRAKARFEWQDTRSYPRFIRSEKEALRSNLAKIDAAIATLKPDRAILELEAKKATIALKKLEKAFREFCADGRAMRCTAPCDGMVFYGTFEDGKWDSTKAKETLVPDGKLAVDKVFMTILDPKKMTLKLVIEEKDFSAVSVGQKGFFRANAYPEREFPTTLTELNEIPLGTAYEAAATTELDPAVKCYPGMKGKTTLFVVRKTNSLLVPEAAVGREADLRRFVMVLNKEKNELEKRFIQVGRKNKEQLEILDGLDVGAEVLKDWTKQ